MEKNRQFILARRAEWDKAMQNALSKLADIESADIKNALTPITRLTTEVEELRKEIAQERESLAEIKVLRGILPICSFCRKIRNDDGYCEQIESCIHKHSGVDFSHTICPSCIRKNMSIS